MRPSRIRQALALVPCLLLAGAALADGFCFAPHLQNVTQDGATLIWETQEDGIGVVEYGLEGAHAACDFDQQAKESQSGKIHRVRVTGLRPETAYSYRMRAGTEERSNTFKTAPATDRAITFTTIGDSRRWENRWQETNMAAHMMQWNPEFCINNGDLVVEGHKYGLWPEHFGRFADFNGKIMMVAARGNHEGSRKADEQNDWFSKYHELPGAGEPFAAFDWGNTHFVIVSVDSVLEAADQLDQHLAGIKKKYTVVVFHYPVYSTGYASPEDSRKDDGKKLSAIWSVMDKYNVTLHLSGHTHIFERTWPLRDGKRDDRRGTTYIVQGGDINANYPDWWSAATDDRATQAKPTYTLIACKDDRVDIRTFAWGTQANKIIEIDHNVICRDEAVQAALLAGLASKKGQELIADIEELGAMIYAPAARPLLAYLKDTDPAIRQAAATAIRSIGNGDVAEALAPYLNDADLVVRRSAARALEIAMPETMAKAVAEQVCDTNQDEETRVSLIGALEFHAPAALTRDTLIDVLKSDRGPAGPTPKVRNRAAYSLAGVAEKDDVKAIAKLFEKETEPYAMLRLAHALNQLTGKRLSLGDKQPLAKSTPGNRSEFTKEWLAK